MKRYLVIALLMGLGLAGAWSVGTTSGGSGSSSSSGSTSSSKSAAKAPSADDWYDQGYAAAMAKDYSTGAEAFRKAIGLYSGFAEAYNMLGFCLRNLGKLDQAFAAYDKALALKPNFAEAREYYGEAWLMRGNVAKAEEQYQILLKAGSAVAPELREKIDDYKANH